MEANREPAHDPAWEKAPAAKGRNPGGQPRKVAPWFEDVARTMADGTSLRVALARSKVRLTEREMNNLYRLRGFRAIYQRERRAYLKRWGRSRPIKRIERFLRGPREQ